MEENTQEEENTLPEDKPQGPTASTKGNDSATCKGEGLVYKVIEKVWTALLQFFAKYWSWLKEHKYDVISGFFVAAAAVLFACWLTGIGEQKALDRATRLRLFLACIERYCCKRYLSSLCGSWDPFIHAVAGLAVIWLILWWMYRKKAFIKV
ncbi:hypothetical protein ES703_77173 [subsurface metagenome]